MMRRTSMWMLSRSRSHISLSARIPKQNVLGGLALGRRWFASLDDIPSIELSLPALSPTMETGTINQWKKKVGDLVEAGDVVADIQTDKATVDFECQDEGYVAAFLIGEGEEYPVGTPVAILVENKEDIEKAQEIAKTLKADATATSASDSPTSAPAAASESAGVSGQGGGSALPSAAILMERHRIDPTSVKASGPKGNILKGDVLKALESGNFKILPESKSLDATPTQPQAQAQAVKPEVKSAAVPASSGSGSDTKGRGYTDIPLTNMRKVIASRLTESKQNVPHAMTTITCSLNNILALRKGIKDQGNKPPSLNDFVIKAAALALTSVPEANCTWDDKKQSSVLQSNVDISVAVATPDGLITPIIKSADHKRLGQISTTMKDLAVRAKDKKLLPEEFMGGSFTISNLGMFGISQFVAVINPPQACILAVGGGEDKMVDPNVLDLDSMPNPADLSKATVMSVTLSSDERCVDQAIGSRLLQSFRGYMENPMSML
ncbi:hypothetical protein AAMO2058_001178200 [Amorphochlora amoebiformis]